MPDSCQQPDDRDVPHLHRSASPVSAQRYIHILLKPGAQGDMPPAPEIGDALRRIGIPEILREMKAHHRAQPHGHIRITGKIKVDLHAERQNPHPHHQDGPLCIRNTRNLRPQRSYGIGDQYLLSQAHGKQKDSPGKSGKVLSPLPQFLCNGVIPHDWSRDQLGKHGNIGAKIDDILLRAGLLPVDVDRV